MVKIPRWPGIEQLQDAIDAGEQPSTVAEFQALKSIAAAVAASGDPGLTMVEPIAYIPEINGILMQRLEARSMQRTLRFGVRRRDLETIFARTGRLVSLIHGIAPTGRPADSGGLGASVARLAVEAEGVGPPELHLLLDRLATATTSYDSIPEPFGNLHGDLNMANVLVDQAARVSVIDPNPANGPQLEDMARFLGDIRFPRQRLASGGWLGASAARERWAAEFEAASGAEGEPALPFREAIELARRWLRIEAETSGVRRIALLPARRLLGREFRLRVESLGG